jgi:integrase
MRILKQLYKDRKSGKWVETTNWYCEIKDHSGAARRFPGYTDRDATESLGKQIKRLIECRGSNDPLSPDLSRWLSRIPAKLRQRFAAIGLIDPERAGGGKPLTGHISDFEQALTDKGNTGKHAKLVVARVKRIIDGCKFIVWGDISASRVQRFLSELRTDTTDKRGISNQTFNFYLQAIKEFCNWAVQDRRASESPLRHLKGLNVRTDRRHDRRALTADEIRRLLETTAAQPLRYCMTGPGRAMLYRFATESGLRANELRTLKVSSLDLNGCAVTVSAAYSKHRREDTLPIRPDTAAQLKEFTKGKLPTALVFDMPKLNRLVKMLKDDLEAAGISYVDDSGRYADFHSLRHTTGTLLAAAGVHPKTAQSIMRHSTIELTMTKYTHVLAGQESQAVESLPDLSQPSRQAQAAIATGTDDTCLPSCLPFQTGRNRNVSDNTGTTEKINCDTGRKNPLNGAGGIRTPVTRKDKTVFKTVAISRSATAP